MKIALLLILLSPFLYFGTYLVWPCDQTCTAMEWADQQTVRRLLQLTP